MGLSKKHPLKNHAVIATSGAAVGLVIVGAIMVVNLRHELHDSQLKNTQLTYKLQSSLKEVEHLEKQNMVLKAKVDICSLHTDELSKDELFKVNGETNVKPSSGHSGPQGIHF